VNQTGLKPNKNTWEAEISGRIGLLRKPVFVTVWETSGELSHQQKICKNKLPHFLGLLGLSPFFLLSQSPAIS
jgi:hypothetical protein